MNLLHMTPRRAGNLLDDAVVILKRNVVVATQVVDIALGRPA